MTLISKLKNIFRSGLIFFGVVILCEFIILCFGISKPLFAKVSPQNPLLVYLIIFYLCIAILAYLGYLGLRKDRNEAISTMFFSVYTILVLLAPYLVLKYIWTIIFIPNCVPFTFTDYQIAILCSIILIGILSIYILTKIWRKYSVFNKVIFGFITFSYMILDILYLHNFSLYVLLGLYK